MNPRLIYCSITGFGQTGPYAQHAGYDYIVQGMSGLMSITGPADGEPHKVGVAVTDLFTGMYAVSAITAALYGREKSGHGERIDLALFDCALTMLANVNMNWLVGGKTPPRLGNGHANIVPYQVFAASDGHFILACGNDSQFARVAEQVGLPALAQDDRFATNPQRVAHRELLVPQLAEVFATRGRDEWLARLDAAGVPCGPINTVDEAFADPQIVARGLRADLVDGHGRAVPQVVSPIRLEVEPLVYHRAPPALGEHTDEVLAELGYSGDEVARLRAQGVI